MKCFHRPKPWQCCCLVAIIIIEMAILNGCFLRLRQPRQMVLFRQDNFHIPLPMTRILPQNLPAPHILVEDMVAFGSNPYLDLGGHLGTEDQQMVFQAMEDADVVSLQERFVDTLSGGERQRVSLAMILAQNSPTAVLDEPTAHMDPFREVASCVD